MPRYECVCYSRKVGAIGQHGTHVNKVIVECEPDAINETAIKAHYEKHTDLEHVRVVQRRELEG